MRVLIVEPDNVIAKILEHVLLAGGIESYRAWSGVEALETIDSDAVDLILMDLDLPDVCGFDLLHQIRQEQNAMPIVVLSARDNVETKVKAFSFGADDYITKPYYRDELVARLHAIHRRYKGLSQSEIKTGRMTVNLEEKRIYIDDTAIPFTIREYQFLELMSLRKGKTLTKDMFIHHLYGANEAPDRKTIDKFISMLRKKLSDHLDGENYIETIWGRGYALQDPEVQIEHEMIEECMT